MDKAYLVAFIDTNTTVVTSVGIFSASALNLTTLGDKTCGADLLSADGADYGEARRALIRMIRGYGHLFAWTIPFLEKEYGTL